MKQIWKFKLERPENSFGNFAMSSIPKGIQWLTAQIQDGFLVLWGLVDPNAERENVSIYIAGTGKEIPNEVHMTMNYLATVQQCEFVWHIYIDE